MTTAALPRHAEPPRSSRKTAKTPRRGGSAKTSRAPLTWRSVVPGLASAVLSAQVILIMVAVFSSYAVNGPTVVVIGGSMEPNVPKGSVLVAKLPEPGSIKEGTIVVYEGDNGTVTHRVVAASGDGEFITRGDANAQDDSTPLTTDRIKGQARLIVPWIGWPRVWWQEANYTWLGGWIALLLALVWLSGSGERTLTRRSRAIENEATETESDDDSMSGTASATQDPAAADPRSLEVSPADNETTLIRGTVLDAESVFAPPPSPAPRPAAQPTSVVAQMSVQSHRCQRLSHASQRPTYRVAWTPPSTAGGHDRVPRRAAF